MERWNAVDRADIRRVMNQICDGNLNPDTLARSEKGQDLAGLADSRAFVLSALNFYEELAIGIFEESIDEEKADRFFASIVDQPFIALRGWIEQERKIDRTPRYFIEFQRLAEGWSLTRT
ncbi:MAG: DUF4760 domain-containing protein [Bryobacteraceae bacterium]